MTAQLSPDALRLRAIRSGLEAIAPGEWTNVRDAEGCFVEARGPMGELLPVLRFDPGATTDEMAFVTDAPATVGFLLGLLDRAISASRAVSQASPAGAPAGRADGRDGRSALPGRSGARGEPQGKAKNFAAEAAMLCERPVFMVFLEERHGLERPLSPEKAAQKLRSLCGVTSRKELNDGGRAGEAWRQLRDEFKAWERAGR